jgi:BMFP domain-containing protein YqiC
MKPVFIGVLCGSILALTAFVCLFVETLTRVTAEMPIVADKAIAREGMLTRAAAEKQIRSLRNDLFARVDMIQAKTFDELDQIRIDANQQIDATRTAAVNEIRR